MGSKPLKHRWRCRLILRRTDLGFFTFLSSLLLNLILLKVDTTVVFFFSLKSLVIESQVFQRRKRASSSLARSCFLIRIRDYAPNLWNTYGDSWLAPVDHASYAFITTVLLIWWSLFVVGNWLFAGTFWVNWTFSIACNLSLLPHLRFKVSYPLSLSFL